MQVVVLTVDLVNLCFIRCTFILWRLCLSLILHQKCKQHYKVNIPGRLVLQYIPQLMVLLVNIFSNGDREARNTDREICLQFRIDMQRSRGRVDIIPLNPM